MELGSTSGDALASSQEHPAISSSSTGGSLVSSFNTVNSSSCNKAPPAVLSGDHDGIEDEMDAQTPSNGAKALMHENLNQESTENGAFEAERLSADTLQETCKEHGFKDRECDDPEAREVIENFEPEVMEADEQAAMWISAEKSAAKLPQKETSYNAPASRRRIFFMIRMPRAMDSQLRTKIKVAELQLEEASKTRDVIRAALQLKRASKIGLLDKLKVVRDKERACKDLFQKKRLEIDPFQAALNRFKFADIKFKEEEIFSEEDLDNKIARLQHRIQHESIPLKEEKQLIREIKQLESQRSQVCANDAEHAHLLESYGPREDIQEHLDGLYRELDVLRAHQNQARLECEPIEKELEDLNVKIDELVEQLEGAKRAQGAALTACKELKKCLTEQNTDFYKYKDDIRKAKELAFSKNLDQLSALCHEQVESILRCWNSDSGFRERYIKNNERSTLRRLETLDGRSLGPDEEPLLLMGDMDLTTETLSKSNESGSKLVLKEVIGEAPVSPGPAVDKVKKLQADEVQRSASAISLKKEKTVDSKKSEGMVAQNLESTKPPSIPTVTAPVEDAAVKEAQAAELKEKRRQEEIGKAKEAAERKRRQAERAQAKSLFRAQREAERREKEREKKARKKVKPVETGDTEDVKPVEMPEKNQRKREVVVEDLPKGSAKGSSSRGKGSIVHLPKSRRHPVVNPPSKKKWWQVPFPWMWVSFVILVIGLALVFVSKF